MKNLPRERVMIAFKYIQEADASSEDLCVGPSGRTMRQLADNMIAAEFYTMVAMDGPEIERIYGDLWKEERGQ